MAAPQPSWMEGSLKEALLMWVLSFTHVVLLWEGYPEG